MYNKVKVDDSFWTLEDGKEVSIALQKVRDLATGGVGGPGGGRGWKGGGGGVRRGVTFASACHLVILAVYLSSGTRRYGML